MIFYINKNNMNINPSKIWESYGPNIWFKSSIENDEMIKATFGELFHSYNYENELTEKYDLINGIILCDQVARHIYRNDTKKIIKYGKYALKYAYKFLNKYKPESRFELLFVSLVLRHWPNESRIKTVLNLYTNYSLIFNDMCYVEKLKKTTVKRYKSWLRNNKVLKYNDNGEVFNSEILDEKCIKKANLEFENIQNNYYFKKFASNVCKYSKVLLSLSGGVDSMVLCLFLIYLKDHGHIDFDAYHLNYNVRNESNAEAQYLKKFCEKYNVNFHYYSINKEDTSSVNWEAYSKEMRYKNYKKTLELMKDKTDEIIPVILGHHLDDIEENILMNLFNSGTCNGNRFLWYDIGGMTSKCLINNVNIYRPLFELGIHKEKILNISEKYNVPYFKDTSFEMATRTRVRRELIPLMRDIFGDSVRDRISKINNESKELESIIKEKIECISMDNELILNLEKILKSHLPNKMIASAIGDSVKNKIFDYKENIPSNKSLYNLIDLIKHSRKDTLKIIFRSSYFGIYSKKTNLLTIRFGNG